MIGNKIHLLTNVFPKVLNHKPLIILITKMRGLTHSLSNLLHIHGFLIGEKNLKHFFQTGSRNGGFSLELFRIFFILKYKKLLIISKSIVKVFSPLETAIHSPFVLSLGSLGFSVGTLPLIICSRLLFPQHLAREFKIKWWAAFKISRTQTFESIKDWIDSKKSKPKKSSKKTHVWSSSLPGPLSWPQTPSKTYFPSNFAYKAYLKKVQEQASETLSQLADSDDNDEDTTSSSAFQQNKDMCYGLPYTPLE